MSDASDYWADHNEVLLHKQYRELYHVRARYWNVDHDGDNPDKWGRYYRLEDDTHTAQEHWREEDLTDCFQKIEGGVVVSGKPVQAEELRYWYD